MTVHGQGCAIFTYFLFTSLHFSSLVTTWAKKGTTMVNRLSSINNIISHMGLQMCQPQLQQLESHWGLKHAVESYMSLKAIKAWTLEAGKPQGLDLWITTKGLVSKPPKYLKATKKFEPYMKATRAWAIACKTSSCKGCNTCLLSFTMLRLYIGSSPHHSALLVLPFVCIQAFLHICCKCGKNTCQLSRFHLHKQITFGRPHSHHEQLHIGAIDWDHHCVRARWNFSFLFDSCILLCTFRITFRVFISRIIIRLRNRIFFCFRSSSYIEEAQGSSIPHLNQVGQGRASCQWSILAGSSFAQHGQKASMSRSQPQILVVFKFFDHWGSKRHPFTILPFHLPALPEFNHDCWCIHLLSSL